MNTYLQFSLSKLEKEEQINPKESRREITKFKQKAIKLKMEKKC